MQDGVPRVAGALTLYFLTSCVRKSLSGVPGGWLGAGARAGTGAESGGQWVKTVRLGQSGGLDWILMAGGGEGTFEHRNDVFMDAWKDDTGCGEKQRDEQERTLRRQEAQQGSRAGTCG